MIRRQRYLEYFTAGRVRTCEKRVWHVLHRFSQHYKQICEKIFIFSPKDSYIMLNITHIMQFERTTFWCSNKRFWQYLQKEHVVLEAKGGFICETKHFLFAQEE